MSKILIVDDEPSVRITLKAVLESEGYEVEEAKDADEGWTKTKMSKPDLILLDIMMPGMRPVDLIKRIKDNSMLKNTKIIYVTAVSGVKKAAESEGDVFATIEKPFKNEELLAIVKEALGQA